MKTFTEYLKVEGVEGGLASTLVAIFDGCKRISEEIVVSDTGKLGSENKFGEQQLAMDVAADRILHEEMKKCGSVGLISSEEVEGEVELGDGEYACCYDPLDGSSLFDVNLTVGTIVGVYKSDKFIGVQGREQKAAVVAVYGPRTTVLLTIGEGVVEFTLSPDEEWKLSQEVFEIKEGKMFAPGNLRACKERPDYLELVNYWIKEQYTLRYSGGMVPDINHILKKGKGIFSYPGYGDMPDGKLRLLIECAPMAFLVEQAGGAASDGKEQILDKVVESLDQRTPIYIGSKSEVERCESSLL